MNIFSFTAHFDSEEACLVYILNRKEIKLVLSVVVALTGIIIG